MPIVNSIIHESVKIWHPELVNIYDSEINSGSTVSSFVEIGGAIIGKGCKIGCQSYICPMTKISDFVFISHGARFCNVKYPKADVSQKNNMKGATVLNGATIGAGAIILPGVTVGKNSFIGAGSVVSRDVPDGAVVAGVPAKIIADANDRKWMEKYGPLMMAADTKKFFLDEE